MLPVAVLCRSAVQHQTHNVSRVGNHEMPERDAFPTRVSPPPQPRLREGVSARALVIGFLLTPLNVFFIHGFTWLLWDLTGWQPLVATSVTGILVFAVLTAGLRRWRPRYAFSAGELLTIYVLLALGTGLVTVIWAMASLSSVLTYPFYYASAENGWEQLLWPNLPSWLTVRAPEALDGFLLGQTTPYRWSVLRAWAAPTFWWTSFLTALLWVCLCLNSIVRRRWEEEEKLSYPLVIVPMQITDERGGLLRNRVFWLTIVGWFAVEAWNVACNYSPGLPRVYFKFIFHRYLAGLHPWDQIPIPVIQTSPLALGMIYLIPLDLTFSLFAFNMLWNVEYVLAAWLGWTSGGNSEMPYATLQSIGGLYAFVGITLWLDRRYLAQVLRRALGLRTTIGDDRQEALTYRAAVWGALAGVAFLWWLLARAGMSQWVAVSFLGLYFATMLGLSRLRVQLGPPAHVLENMMPNRVLYAAAGTRALGPRSLGILGLLGPYLGGQFSHPAPVQLEGLKMASHGRMSRRRLAVAMALVVPVVMLSYFWTNLHYGYQLGMASADVNPNLLTAGAGNTADIDFRVRYPEGPDLAGVAAMGVGSLLVLVLAYLKLNLASWPLHPAAVPLTFSYCMEELTVPLFALWLVKILLLRYGGLRAYRAGLPLFLGLIVGDCLSRIVFGFLVRLFGLHWMSCTALAWGE